VQWRTEYFAQYHANALWTCRRVSLDWLLGDKLLCARCSFMLYSNDQYKTNNIRDNNIFPLQQWDFQVQYQYVGYDAKHLDNALLRNWYDYKRVGIHCITVQFRVFNLFLQHRETIVDTLVSLTIIIIWIVGSKY